MILNVGNNPCSLLSCETMLVVASIGAEMHLESVIWQTW